MSLFGNLQPSALHRVRASSGLMNEDPSTWTGDWRKCPDGRYLTGNAQKTVNTVLTANDRMIVGLAMRSQPNAAIGAIMGVSREAVAKRLRLRKFNVKRGNLTGLPRKPKTCAV